MATRAVRRDHASAETEFLRREVANLELAITTLRSSRQEQGTREAEAALLSASEALADSRAEGTTLALHAQLLHGELEDAEAERQAANEAEAYALSVARSYR
eukprot:3224461-Prymnesium_polylepis.1